MTEKSRWIYFGVVGMAFFALILAGGYALTGYAFSGGEEVRRSSSGPPGKRASLILSAAGPESYEQACSSCHLPFRADLMTAEFWDRLLGNLDRHYGTRVRLSENQTRRVRDYLESAAADRVPTRLGERVMKNREPYPPLRLSDSALVRRTHAKTALAAGCACCHD